MDIQLKPAWHRILHLETGGTAGGLPSAAAHLIERLQALVVAATEAPEPATLSEHVHLSFSVITQYLQAL